MEMGESGFIVVKNEVYPLLLTFNCAATVNGSIKNNEKRNLSFIS